MVIDTSAILAILQGESERRIFIEAIESADIVRMSVASFVETSIVIESRYGVEGLRDLDRFISRASTELVTFWRKNHFPSENGHPLTVARLTKMPGSRPAGHSTDWFWGTSKFQFSRSANTVPRWCRLSAMTPNPTQRFIPLSPL